MTPFWMRDPRTWRLRTDLGPREHLLFLLITAAFIAAGWVWSDALVVTSGVVLGAVSTASRVATVRKKGG